MICPHCKKTLKMEPYVLNNVSAYGKPAIGRANCCGKAVQAWAVISYKCEAINGVSVDDWGQPINGIPGDRVWPGDVKVELT